MTITYEDAYRFYKFQEIPDEEIEAWIWAAIKRGRLLSDDFLDLLKEYNGLKAEGIFYIPYG